jgi:hypothetical protein
MAIFADNEEDKTRVDWHILRDGSVSLYLRPQYLNEDVEWLRRHGYQIFQCDCSQWTTEEAMHAGFQQALSFPAYYGKNVNALADCLSDLPVPDAGGTALVLHRFDAYAKGAGTAPMHFGRTEGEVVLDILALTSKNFMLRGKRFSDAGAIG